VPKAVGDPQRGLAGAFRGSLGGDGVDQDAGQHGVLAVRNAHLHVDVGGRVRLRSAPGTARAVRAVVAGPQQPGGDQLVQVEGR
jgi:hypothetical protein